MSASPARLGDHGRGARTPWLLALGASLLLVGGPGRLVAQSFQCVPGDRAAATLLFPYFEVDTDGSRTTLISITNVDPISPALARVTLWTDWALPTLAFDIFLRGGDVLTLNVRDLFGDRLPHTGPGASVFPGCNDVLGLLIIDREAQRLRHSGRPSGTGMCWSSPRSDPTLLNGYITVDVTNRCPGAGVTPATRGYFAEPNRVAADRNTLVGDFFLVDPVQDYAGGQSAVHLTVPSVLPGFGDYTFYGRYVDFVGDDHRVPLSNFWMTRFLTGGGFDGGTHLLVWRDTRRSETAPFECGVRTPPWLPLGEQVIAVSPESGGFLGFFGTEAFDLATQRISVGDLGLPFPFGMLRVALDHRDGTHAQGWIGWDANAQGRYNVSLAGIPLLDPCALTP